MKLASYIARRLLQLIPTIVFILIVVFALVRMLPGDPASAILGDRALDADVERINRELGLDRPSLVQFAVFVEFVATGNLGDSIHFKLPVTELIAQRLPVTMMLTVMAALIAVVMAVPLAFVAALLRGKPADSIVRGAFQVGLSMPVFYFGRILLTIFGAKLRWFPVGGYGDGFLDNTYHLFLSAVALAFSLSATLMRNLRSAVIGVIDAEYVQFARSKGLAPKLVLFRHVRRNALISAVALFGLSIGMLLSGAVITETVFAILGAGRLMVDSIYGRDYPVVQGLTIAPAVVMSVTFLLIDLVQV